jgi:Undecaprenyl-phosphate galactose phosphotransferase WbaP
MKSGKKEREFTERRRRNYDAQAAMMPSLSFMQRHAREFMTLSLLLSDLISLLLAFGLAVWLRVHLIGDYELIQFNTLIPILVFFLITYASNGLYPGVGLSPVTEMKQLMNSTNIVFLLLIAFTFWEQTSTNYSRFILGAAWLLALVLVQVDRWLTRILGRKLGYWGEPVAIIGSGAEGQHITKFLNDRIRLGMLPVLTIDGYANYEETPLVVINQSNIRTIILVTEEMSADMQKRLVSDQRLGYYRRHGEKSIPSLIIISSLGWVGSLGITPLDMDGLLGLEVRQNLLNKWPIFLKRTIDLSLTLFFGMLLMPFFLLIMGLIQLDSPGRVFYSQERVGHNGKIFKMWKFRTMKADAEKILQSLLASNPEIKAEWEENQKLKNDPRITRVGKVLRKLSLDELPQLINVLKGEMSLVGPRPVFQDQLENFGDWIKIYNRVRPGMTGMWQVRGRNDNSFIGKERQRLDEYYIRNWSVWLDVYIIVLTVREVLIRRGAY